MTFVKKLLCSHEHFELINTTREGITITLHWKCRFCGKEKKTILDAREE